jgi:hypothetical protein
VKRKSKLKHPRPSSPNNIVIDDDLVLGRNRRVVEYGKIVHEKEEELSDYVKIRLLVSRMKALEAHRKAQV